MRLFILLLFCFQGDVYSKEDQTYCTEQPDSIMVDVGGSVTIPCHYSYPKKDNLGEKRVYWRQATGGRCGNNEIIYSHTEQKTHADYVGRITMEGNPQKERTATIRIKELKETDGPMFCCKISLYIYGQPRETWQNQHGTYIKFKGQFYVEQPDVVPAVIGEDISIPCALHNKSPDSIEEIIWRVGTSDLCFENNEFLRWNTENITRNVGRWRVQKSENIFLLHIKSVTHSDIRQYCCEVNTKTRSDGRSSAHGTQVVIADPTQNDPEFTVTQSENILANEGDSVTIGCSYTVPPDRNLLWSGVFWRVGTPTGPFAYHPSALMVHSSYRGRTQLSGLADLQINGVQDSDTTTYYCFVMLKFCIGTNKTNSVLKYGSGTQLNLNVKNQTSTGDVYSKEDQPFCTEQPDSIMVDVGESVTIPCNFSYPKNDEPEEVRVYWRHATGGRCGMNKIIYNHTEKTQAESDYVGRISMEGNPQKEKTATLRIKELKKTDGPMFCCRIELYNNGQPKEKWQNRHGTYIRFKDQYFVEQPDVVPAVIGEDISIPCALHNKSPDAIEEIIWRVGTSDLCFENNEFLRWKTENITQRIGPWRVQKSENIFLLHMNNVTHSDSRQYCCEVNTKTRDGRESFAHGTQLVIADPTQNDPEFTVTQSEIISANEGDSVTISCSYIVPPDQNLLWSGVFWRVGTPTGPFAYHPSALMVHTSYRGRTQLSGLADLQINGVQDTDNTTYYCFVMLKFCIGTNKTSSVLKYRSGTQLNFNVKNQTSTDFTGQQTVILAAYFGIKIFLLVLIIILCAVYVKRK